MLLSKIISFIEMTSLEFDSVLLWAFLVDFISTPVHNEIFKKHTTISKNIYEETLKIAKLNHFLMFPYNTIFFVFGCKHSNFGTISWIYNTHTVELVVSWWESVSICDDSQLYLLEMWVP